MMNAETLDIRQGLVMTGTGDRHIVVESEIGEHVTYFLSHTGILHSYTPMQSAWGKNIH